MTEKRKSKYARIMAALLAVIVLLSFSACGGNGDADKWDDIQLAKLLPMPENGKIDIGLDLDDTFSADVEDISKDNYNSYVEKCKEKGFDVDSESKSDEYTSYNKEGYRLELSYNEYSNKYSIRLETPKTNGTFEWPKIGLATKLPTPKTKVGTITIDSSSQFNAYIGETTLDDYNTYINECIEIGFDVDYDKSEKLYSADNEQGDSLRIEYQGFNTMYISMYAADDNEDNSSSEAETEATEATKAEEKKESSSSEASSSKSSSESASVTASFKETMDEYEEFMNKYVEFMKKYSESDNPIGMLSEYTDMLSTYSDFVEKIDGINQDELSAADLAYYLEVTARVTKKLAEIQ